MRTQHLMIQEMENIRGEISALRGQTLAARSQSVPRGLNALQGQGDAALTNPTRVKKLTKFFGDEPPLLRLFLKKLGYEKYAGLFETERVGMVELPYMTEEMLQKMGIPLGPRLRILQEAQISVQCRDKVYVVFLQPIMAVFLESSCACKTRAASNLRQMTQCPSSIPVTIELPSPPPRPAPISRNWLLPPYYSSYHVLTLPPSTPAVSHQSPAKWSHPVCVPNLVSGAGEKLLYFRDNVIPRTCAGTKALRTG
uniref:SAM domain-containing protein n=1 Tax=Timema douglasi TaxID=61478 RepID=A0A7R8ZCT0_TIMDO|nr:unnamed protein product [Timema douglasi]